MRLAFPPAGRDSSVPARWRRPLAVGVAAAGAGVLLIALFVSRNSVGWGYDFAAYYEAALRLAQTGSPYQAETLLGPFRPGPGGLYLYSPALAVLLLPIVQLPFAMASVLWLVLRLVLLAATCALMPLSRSARLALFGVICLTPSAFEDLNLGNVSLIVTFLGVAAWRTLDRPLAGVAIAGSILLRPTMALVALWWILRRKAVPVVATVAALAAAILVTLPFVGFDGWLDYATVLRNVSDVTGVHRNFDMGSFALRAGAPPWLVTAVLLATYAVAGGAILLSLRRDRDLGFAVTMGATLLASPLLWNHYMVHLLVPAAFLASRGRPWGLALPLLTWLPHDLLGFVALAATLLPFAARDRVATGVTAAGENVSAPPRERPAAEPAPT